MGDAGPNLKHYLIISTTFYQEAKGLLKLMLDSTWMRKLYFFLPDTMEKGQKTQKCHPVFADCL